MRYAYVALRLHRRTLLEAMLAREPERYERELQYFRAIFDGFPVAAFIVDAEMRICDFNTAAEPFLGAEAAIALYQRTGDAFHCMYAEANGCGKADVCRDCILRKSVQAALLGNPCWRQPHHAVFSRGPLKSVVDLLVSASLLPYQEYPCALVVVENLSDLKKRLPDKAAKSTRSRGPAH